MGMIDVLEQQLAEAQRAADAIRAELEEARNTGRAQAVTQIFALMVEWDITLADLGCQRRTRRTKQATEQQDQTPEPTAVDAERLDAIEDEQEADQEPLQEAA